MLQRGFLLRRQRAGLVDDTPRQRGHGHLRCGGRKPTHPSGKQQRQAGPAEPVQTFACGHLVAPDPAPEGLAGAVSKPTLGGLSIAFSLSTVKVGFSL